MSQRINLRFDDPMHSSELVERRLRAQGLGDTGLPTPWAVVRRLAAVQAQDLGQAIVAIASRSPAATHRLVKADLATVLVRTHILRPTWHIVCADDLRWMMDLTGPRVAQVSEPIFLRLGLTKEVRSRSRGIVEKCLADGPQPRDVLVKALTEAGLCHPGIQAAQLLIAAELSLVVCSGPMVEKEQTYDLVDRRIPPALPLDRDEALGRLARRYIEGHGPATARDFGWWSGLTLTDAKRGLAAAQPALQTSGDWWMASHDGSDTLPRFHFLAAFDEYLIAFEDRSAALSAADRSRVLTANGIFRPAVLFDGRVVGVWRPKTQSRRGPLSVEWFLDPPPGAQQAVEAWETALRQWT